MIFCSDSLEFLSKQSETVKEFTKLKAENESLKKQLENSVQLPCKVGDKE